MSKQTKAPRVGDSMPVKAWKWFNQVKLTPIDGPLALQAWKTEKKHFLDARSEARRQDAVRAMMDPNLNFKRKTWSLFDTSFFTTPIAKCGDQFFLCRNGWSGAKAAVSKVYPGSGGVKWTLRTCCKLSNNYEFFKRLQRGDFVWVKPTLLQRLQVLTLKLFPKLFF
jgi:hypothetical protein